LQYHLQNKNLFPIRTEIALPPDTNYQKVGIDSLSPEPVQVHADTDGNWLAEYNLSPSQRLEVTAKGNVVIALNPDKVPETAANLKQYLEEKQYWQTSNAKIQQLAKELQTPEAIYDYIVKTLNYDFSRVTGGKSRLGAVGVIEHPSSAVCLEFTDMFVAIARAAGIPAREVDGYAYTQNPKQRPLSLVQDILHAWPEYYDPAQQTWVMVDPTWGNTTGGVDYFHTLDFDHLTLVKKGVSSTYPIPAGGYKTAGDEDKKDVNVSFSDSVTLAQANLTLDPAIADSHTAGFPIGGSITVVNTGPSVSTDQSVTVTATTLSPKQQKLHIGSLLPFERKDIALSFDKQPLLTNSTHIFTMNLAGKTESKTIHVVPVFLEEWRFLGGILLALFTIIILIIAVKAGRIHLS
jgi:transglutaminase-like putative cysteine protease